MSICVLEWVECDCFEKQIKMGFINGNIFVEIVDREKVANLTSILV